MAEIERDLDILLDEIGEESIQRIVLAGGSSYIRQLINFVRAKFSHLYKDDQSIDKFIFLDEPDNAIAYGALEYQRNDSEGKEIIRPRLSMSTYLAVDYDHQRDISNWQRRLSSVEFIRYDGRSYIELARKGEPLKSKRPRLRPPQRIKFIPVCPGCREIHWKIFQVSRTSKDGKDYKAITSSTQPIDEIKMKLPRWQTRLPISLSYAFDIYADFYRVARPYGGLRSQLKTQWEKAPEFDWRNRDLIGQARQKYFESNQE